MRKAQKCKSYTIAEKSLVRALTVGNLHFNGNPDICVQWKTFINKIRDENFATLPK